MQVVRVSCVGQSAGCSWALVCIKPTGPSSLSLFRCKFSVRGETSRHLISVQPPEGPSSFFSHGCLRKMQVLDISESERTKHENTCR
ncbi:uncharacterized [Lates japonicus]